MAALWLQQGSPYFLKIELFFNCVINTISIFNIFSVFADTDGTGCVTASFVFGGGSDSRQYDIRVRIFLQNI